MTARWIQLPAHGTAIPIDTNWLDGQPHVLTGGRDIRTRPPVFFHALSIAALEQHKAVTVSHDPVAKPWTITVTAHPITEAD